LQTFYLRVGFLQVAPSKIHPKHPS
jgi:hypothetical protein